MPPAEVLFDQYVVRKLAVAAFQDPVKVADGLSLIWAETHKWQVIASAMRMSEQDTTKTLKLISIRRNSIVHQADTDPFTSTKTPLSRDEANSITDFIELCGSSIANLVV